MGLRLVVLASGRGSNFEAIADAVKKGELPNAEMVALITNRGDAPALKIAESRDIPSYIIDGKDEPKLIEIVEKLQPNFICLAGYMLVLGKQFLSRWPNQILNIHPSLLPSFKGLKAQKQALEYGVKWTGCTVHFVNEELDGGPVIAQNSLEILEGDTEESLTQRLLKVEHRTYVEALSKVCTRKYQIVGRRVVFI